MDKLLYYALIFVLAGVVGLIKPTLGSQAFEQDHQTDILKASRIVALVCIGIGLVLAVVYFVGRA